MAERKSSRTKRPRGRPVKPINLRELQKLCKLHCTNAEIAAAFGVGERTIDRRYAEDEKFREVVDRGRAEGKRSLRRALFDTAMKAPRGVRGASSALIFLAKQAERVGGLGMSDRMEHDVKVTNWADLVANSQKPTEPQDEPAPASGSDGGGSEALEVTH